MRRLVTVFCVAALSIMLLSPAFCADENKGASAAKQPAENIKTPQRFMPINKDIAFLSGSISKVDSTAPESIKVEVLNDVDGKSHIVEIGATTNILKVVEAKELKAGDKARVVARKTGDKEIAISIVTGKLKEMPRPPAATVQSAIAEKDKIKK